MYLPYFIQYVVVLSDAIFMFCQVTDIQQNGEMIVYKNWPQQYEIFLCQSSVFVYALIWYINLSQKCVFKSQIFFRGFLLLIF